MRWVWLLGLLVVSQGGMAESTSPVPRPQVYIISPAQGELVSNPVLVQFGLRGMGVSPAQFRKKNTGHHHLLIDVEQLPAADQRIPSGENHRHFVGGQTEVELQLAPGRHSLQLLFGNYRHHQFQPPVSSDKIFIEVR